MLERLKLSGLAVEDAKRLGVQLCNEEESAKLGLPRAGVGFKIPYYTATGELLRMFRYRYRDTVERSGLVKGAKLPKYAQPKNTPVEVYFPPLVNWPAVLASKDSIVLTEGELKAACATKMGYPTIGLGGVFNFGSKEKHWKLVPALQDIDWNDRDAVIVFDSDAVTNPQVVLAEVRLAKALSNVGARVFIVRLPPDGKNKVGLDDFLVQKGPVGFSDLVEETREFGLSEALHQLNAEVVYVRHPSMVVELPKDGRPANQPRFNIMRVGEFQNEVYANRRYVVNGSGVENSAAKDWVEWPGRFTLDSVVYEPGQDKFIDGQQLNMWEGWGAKPAKGDVSLFTQLLDFVFNGAEPAHRKWFLQWAAYPLQNPGVKLNSAVVLWSLEQGVGKSLLGFTLGRIYGKNYVKVNKKQLDGSFNGWLAMKQFVVGEEVTGGSGREVADVLKDLITGPEVMVNRKYEPEYTVRNCANFFFTSNHQDAFFITGTDRRYFVHEVADKPSDAFFKKYDRWFKTQVAANALFDYLLHVDLTGFNPMAEAPRTRSRQEMVDAGKSEHGVWIDELKTFPDNKLRVGDVVLPFALYTVEDLLALYQPEDAVVRRRYPVTAKAFAAAMKEAGFKMAAEGAAVDTVKGKKQRLWIVRPCAKLEKLDAKGAGEYYVNERARKKARQPRVAKERK